MTRVFFTQANTTVTLNLSQLLLSCTMETKNTERKKKNQQIG